MRISWCSLVSMASKILKFIEDPSWIASRSTISLRMHVSLEFRCLSYCLLLNLIRNTKIQMISSISFLSLTLKSQWILWMCLSNWAIWKISLSKLSTSTCSRGSLLQNIWLRDLKLLFKSSISLNYRQPKPKSNTSKQSIKLLPT